MVHTFSALGRNLAVDVNSGAVHVLDKLCYDLLSRIPGPMGEQLPGELAAQLPQYGRAELEEGWQELRALQDQGLLFTTDEYLDPEAAMALPKAAVVKALCLHVSHDCNLRCRYCFASTGDFGTGHRMTMDLETAKRAIDFVIAKSGHRRNIEVDFFGGGRGCNQQGQSRNNKKFLHYSLPFNFSSGMVIWVFPVKIIKFFLL